MRTDAHRARTARAGERVEPCARSRPGTPLWPKGAPCGNHEGGGTIATTVPYELVADLSDSCPVLRVASQSWWKLDGKKIGVSLS
jgi:hypothetical protein